MTPGKKESEKGDAEVSPRSFWGLGNTPICGHGVIVEVG